MADLVTYAIHYRDQDGVWKLHEESGCSFHAARGVCRALAVSGIRAYICRVTVTSYEVKHRGSVTIRRVA